MNKKFIGDYSEEESSFKKYDILSSPNDFNMQTIYNLINSEVIEIPGFQRNYIWDIKRASKLIESFIIGLPVPQIFLYEKAKNKFLVIDGQQRLMTIYYFFNGRFPKMGKRAELRKIFIEYKKIPKEFLDNNEYFDDFKLSLPKLPGQEKNTLDTKNYSSLLEEHKQAFNLRTIRSIIIKQLHPEDGDSSIYEIFNRLNTGGVNLQPQEIRTSLYHSSFYDCLEKMNNLPQWRNVYGKRVHPHMKDVEIILRGFAFLVNYEKYKSSLGRFLNEFSEDAMLYNDKKVKYLTNLFTSFLDKTKKLRQDIFFSNKRFNILVYEAVFYAACKKAYESDKLDVFELTDDKINEIRSDKKFVGASESETGKKYNIDKRLGVASKIISNR